MDVNKRGELSNGLPPDDLSGGGDSEPRPAGLDRKTELELLDAALLDNINAFSELFEHYRPALYGLCCRRLNDFALAEDIVQDVFLKAFKNLPNSDHRKPIWPWLAAIAHRMCIDLQRRRSLVHYSGDIRLTMDEDAETNGHSHTESTLDSVIASEDRVELWKSLDVLPPRQRRAFVLYEVDGLSCADIAAAEGISVAAVYRLLFRARKKMRSVSQGKPLPAIVLPLTWLRWKYQRIEERIRPLLNIYGEGFSSACMQAACLGTVAAIAVAAGHPIQSLERSDPMRFREAVLSATQSQLPKTASQTALSNIGDSVRAPAQSQLSDAGPANSLVDGIINRNQDATPESTDFYSIMASPNYESDHTIVASGIRGGLTVSSSVLFTSRDGGATWKASSSRLLFGRENVVLSPGYPQDQRIFALDTEYYGLQQSDDGGEVFRTVSPVVAGGFAISPLFGRGDSKILMGAERILEYDAVTGVTEPALLSIPLFSGRYASVTFSPSYSSDRTIFVLDRFAKSNLLDSKGQNTLYRCKESICDETHFPFDASVTLRLSPRFDQDGLAYAFANDSANKLLVSKDGARTFEEISMPQERYLEDVAVFWKTASDPDLFVLFRHVVYRSFDAGRSWSKSWINVPGFGYGAQNLIVTPTGRLLAISWANGIACSEDLGVTWAPRCTPEP